MHDTSINLKDIIFSARSQSQRVIYCMIPFIKPSQSDKIVVMEKGLVVAKC